MLDILSKEVTKLKNSDLVTHEVHTKMCADTTVRYLQITEEIKANIARMDDKREDTRAAIDAQFHDMIRRVSTIEASLAFLVANVRSKE